MACRPAPIALQNTQGNRACKAANGPPDRPVSANLTLDLSRSFAILKRAPAL